MIKFYSHHVLGYKSPIDIVKMTFEKKSPAQKEAIRLQGLGYQVDLSRHLIGKLNTAEYDRRGNKLPPCLTPGA